MKPVSPRTFELSVTSGFDRYSVEHGAWTLSSVFQPVVQPVAYAGGRLRRLAACARRARPRGVAARCIRARPRA
ncbi:MAG: hypothetical protein CBARDCOR_3205 [uncultured Caballeronia sp.]|nr:MAG: hypothetical protein CBARDCOR_3205 [uncultured Caballeronia sp.]